MNSLVQLAIDAHGGCRTSGVGSSMCQRTFGPVASSGRLKQPAGRSSTMSTCASRFAESGRRIRRSAESRPADLRSSLTAWPSKRRYGDVVEERVQPSRVVRRSSSLDTPWDPLQLAYFAGYAMWTYLTTPFVLCGATSASSPEEVEPWPESGEAVAAPEGHVPSWHRDPQHRPDLLCRLGRPAPAP